MHDLADIALDTDLEAAAAMLDRPRAEPQFAFEKNRVHTHRAKADERRRRAGIKKLINPANALPIVEHLPIGPGDRTHCLLRGDFVLCDLIPAVIAARGKCDHLRIATLGCSIANADVLASMIERYEVASLDLLVSHYFAQVDKATVFRAVNDRLAQIRFRATNAARLAVTRCHAKVICLPTAAGDWFVIEGSANLRSSDNVEQIVITNDRDTHDFHAAWIDELMDAQLGPRWSEGRKCIVCGAWCYAEHLRCLNCP
ncbi:MAG: hypothetical protein ABMA13_22635 [Chthoniobacteraceae bacterium]